MPEGHVITDKSVTESLVQSAVEGAAPDVLMVGSSPNLDFQSRGVKQDVAVIVCTVPAARGTEEKGYTVRTGVRIVCNTVLGNGAGV